ncbi:facilitated trehalose transporter Tret1-like [Macrobrachium rosenbergii]|uniref:facilitated trehalose transporter Tret1-like n=1 Tax=Macrobrachium rosenbergii TaxID=79674 RepID=UPI0034D3DE66
MMESGASSAQLVDDSRKPSYATQYLGAFSACMGALNFGVAIGYSSPAGSMLVKPQNMTYNYTDGELYLSEGQNSWYASTLNIGAFIGGPLGGLLINAIGRKGAMLSTCVGLLISWLLTIFAQNFAMLISSRVVVGLAIGINCIAANAYIGELASVEIRGTLGSGFQLMVVIGIEFAYIFGAIVDTWQLFATICMCPVFVFFVLILISKESPVYLLSKGKEKEAMASLQFFRGKDYNIQRELDMMRADMEEARENKVSVKDLLVNPHLLKPLTISMALMFFQQFSGVSAVLVNLTSIFKEAGTSIPESLSSILVGLVQIVATAASSLFIDRAGRKILLTGSALFMAISLVALGFFFYEKAIGQADSLQWLPLVSLMLFITSASIGYGPIPWLMMSELFPRAVVGEASSFSIMTNWSTSFVCTLTFTPLQDVIHDYGVFWMFASVCVVNVAFCVLVVPETKGKTVEEISAYFGAPSPVKSDPNEKPKIDISIIS